MTRSICLCVTKIREEEKRIVNYFKEIDIEVSIITDRMCLNFDELSHCDLALIRCLSHKTSLQRATYLEAAGIACLNTAKTISLCTDKGVQAIRFEKAGILMPKFNLCNGYAELPLLLEDYGRYVIKPLSSSWGRGVTLIESPLSLSAWIAARESIDIRGEHFPILVQEYIEKDNFDIRVVIVGSTPIVAFRRTSNDNWKTNTHLGASVIPIVVTLKIKQIVKAIIDEIGPGIYGLDLIVNRNNDELMVCEINQNPEFAISMKIHGVDVAKHIANYVNDAINIREVSYAMQ